MYSKVWSRRVLLLNRIRTKSNNHFIKKFSKALFCLLFLIITNTIINDKLYARSKKIYYYEKINNIDIKGRVVDSIGDPLIDATITIVGTKKNFHSDKDGYFLLKNVDTSNLSIQVSYVGYSTVTIKVDGTQDINIILTPVAQDNNAVVVVGYSNKKKSDLTSAVTVVSADKLKDVTTNDIGSMLQGKVSGLQVVNSSGAPGSSAEIRLRGVSSVNASQSPLYVVDGIIGGNYDPNDVESITVLKDAAATAMYGSQANAGVIIVTTKKAAAGKTRMELKVTTGFRDPYFGSMKMMNGSQLYEAQKEYYRDYTPGASNNSYKVDLLKFYSERPLSLESQNNNWLNTMFKRAPMTNVYFSASGSNEKNSYYLGMTYYDERGTLLNTNFKRINIHANSTHHFTPKISLSNSFNLNGNLGTGYDYNDIFYAYLNMPWDNPYDSTGKPIFVDGNSTFKWWSRDKTNPLHTIQNSSFPTKNFDVNYDLNLNVGITNWLSFSSTNRISAAYYKSRTYYSAAAGGQYYGTGYLDEENTLTYGYISNDLLKFNFNFGKHSLSGLAGFASQQSYTELSGGSGKGLPVGYDVLNVVSTSQNVDGSDTKFMLGSFISQVNYGYNGKYFFTASYRVDGSSNFPSNNRYAPFPAFSASWLINKESFLENSKFIDLLKLRASYGITGTQDIGSSRYLGLYSLSSQYNSSTAAVPTQLPSSNLTWESKYQWDIGLDIGLFKRVELTVDAYRNLTKNLLLQVSQPLSVGFESRWENTGEIDNKGLELGLNTTNIQSKNFTWQMNFNISFNTNKLRRFPATTINTQSTWGISQIYREGGNLYEFYMPKWLGVDNQTGAPLWEKVTTGADGKTIKQATSNYSDATYQEVGSPLPKFQGGWTNSFKYKDITLSINTYFLSGNKVFSNNLRFVENDGSEPYYNQMVLPKGYSVWTKPGDIATEPSPQNATNSTQTSTRYLKDGSFIALRNITLSYSLPAILANKIGFDGVQVGVSADNIYNFTKFLGQDPQTTITPGTYVMPGVSDFKYPNNRQFLFNVDFRF
ncbi:SusC/RagA family TonB-linked outer membrane protein [Rhizosphaericola mali]|uniref:SusC/RagA family TonB-linked outer membrane protein n=1 Tax=Rhizosphaericola mali TaxID=2545455 RepID=A0A5P2G4D7_9BACT|nr:SusC/RagA family TonB-linked outer membrane protein [Rhizosphaericola mali]QES90694.1 SusC/RagA family TonB-linked outer membrane protein [Rhizosphaericola mali]